MLKDRIEPYYLTRDYNCAETTLHIIDDQYGLGLSEEDFKLVGGFGAGFGCGITCGALAGAVAALGKLSITRRAHATEGFRELCAGYCAAFEQALGATDCSRIKETYFAGPQTRCLAAIRAAADCFEEFAREQGIPEKEPKDSH